MGNTTSTAALSAGTRVVTWDGSTGTIQGVIADGWYTVRTTDGLLHQWQRFQLTPTAAQAEEVA